MKQPPSLIAVCATNDTEATIVRELAAMPEEFTVVRRCADLAELCAVVQAKTADVVILEANNPEVDTRLVNSLQQWGANVVVLVEELGERNRRYVGADVASLAAHPEQVIESIRAFRRRAVASASKMLTTHSHPHRDPSDHETLPDKESMASCDISPGLSLKSALTAPTDALSPADTLIPGAHQRLVPAPGITAVWGTSGAPGRSTIAINIAMESARERETILVDADVHNPSVAHMLGIPVDYSGLSACARQIARGSDLAHALPELSVPYGQQLTVLTGLTSPLRWREIDEFVAQRLMEELRVLFPSVVVDLAAVSLDPVGEETQSRGQRDDVAAAVLRQADRVLCVAKGDAVGLNRLAGALRWWEELDVDAPLHVIVNRVSPASTGPHPVNALRAALSPILGQKRIFIVPEDESVPRSLLHASTVIDAHPLSPSAQAIHDLAGAVQLRSLRSVGRKRRRGRGRM
ncbi:hypothetical protein [Schaalia sp. ZJ1691]|uniref:AAA family ATPase n=1 Tax=Schaalia sp. ZJ1691 TaxID=2709404 RepID=UPI0013EE0FA0|nr:hypothetical protein [Schaalia sp. ZJ1691]